MLRLWLAARPFKPFNPIRGEEVITIYADKDYRKMEQVRVICLSTQAHLHS